MLGDTQKASLKEATNSVYNAYLAIDFAGREKLFPAMSGGELLSLEDYISEMIKHSLDLQRSITINGKTWNIMLDGCSITIKADGEASTPQTPALKAINKYSNEEKLQFLSSQKLFIKIDQHNKYNIGVRVKKDDTTTYELGGPGKLPLYRSHLITLHNIVKHLEKSEDIRPMLVALATGSGKTFVQALWFLILHKANINGVFALPDKLIPQFKGDFKRLLPDDMVEELSLLRLGGAETNAAAKAALEKMKTTGANYVVASYEELLDSHYQKLLEDISGSNTALVFDEQHFPMEQEKRHGRLLELSKRFLMMFLTATPTEETYKLCGTPVAAMSSKQKAEAGQGRFPQLRRVTTKSVSDKAYQARPFILQLVRNSLSNIRTKVSSTVHRKERELGKLGVLDIILGKVHSLVANAIQTAYSSTAASMFEGVEFLVEYKDPSHPSFYKAKSDFVAEKRRAARWNLQVPMARNMLVIAYDNEEIVNIHRQLAAQAKGVVNSGVYRDGNVKDRRDVYEFFLFYVNHTKSDSPSVVGQDDFTVDDRTADHYRQRQIAERKAALPEGVTLPSLTEQLKYNILHGMIDYLLSYVTALPVLELNQRRFDDLPALIALVQEKFSDKFPEGMSDEEIKRLFVKKLTYDEDKNPKGIDAAGATEAAEILFLLISYFRNLGKFSDDIPGFVDNWSLNEALHNNLSNYKGKLRYITDEYYGTHILIAEDADKESIGKKIDAFAAKHAIHYVMDGMEDAEVPISTAADLSQGEDPARCRIVCGFTEEKYPLYDDKGLLSEKAKRRKRGALELLNDETKEYRYHRKAYEFDRPKSDEPDVGRVIAVNYAKLSFCGMTVSNVLTEGYSNPTLQTGMSVIPRYGDEINSPVKAVQGVGRLRGLDETKEPYYIEGRGKNVKPAFDLKTLARKEDYFGVFFASQQRYNKAYLHSLGKQVAKKVNQWLQQHMDADDDVDPEEFEKATHHIMLDALHEINNNNSHNFNLSRKQLVIVLNVARKELQAEQKSLKQPYKLSRLIQFVGSALYLSTSAIYRVRNIPTYIRFRVQARRMQEDGSVSNETRIYAKIIRETQYKGLMRNAVVLKEFSNLLKHKEKAVDAQFADTAADLPRYLKPASIATLNANFKKYFVPVLSKFVVDSERSRVVDVANKFKDWHLIVHRNKNLLDIINDSDDQVARAKACLALFRKVPGLHSLEMRDIIVDPKGTTESMGEQAGIYMQALFENQFIQALKNYFTSGAFINETLIYFFDIKVRANVIAIFNAHGEEFAERFYAEIIKPDKADLRDQQNVLAFMETFLVEKNAQPDIVICSANTLAEQAQTALAAIKVLSSTIEENVSEYLVAGFAKEIAPRHLKPATQQDFNIIFKEQLAPVLVKLFPLDFHQQIMVAVLQCDDWHTALPRHVETLQALQTDPTALNRLARELLLGHLHEKELVVDIFAEVVLRDLGIVSKTSAANAKSAILKDIRAVEVTDADVEQAGGYLPVAHSLAATRMLASKLQQAEFQQYFEPVFTFDGYLRFVESLTDHDTAVRFARALMVAVNAIGLDNIADLDLAETLKDVLETVYEDKRTRPTLLQDGMLCAVASLHALQGRIDAAPQEHFEDSLDRVVLRSLKFKTKTEFNQHVHQGVIPILLQWVNSDFLARAEIAMLAYDDWAQLLANHKDELDALDGIYQQVVDDADNVEIPLAERQRIHELVFNILREIPELTTFDKDSHGIDYLSELDKAGKRFDTAIKDIFSPRCTEKYAMQADMLSYLRSEEFFSLLGMIFPETVCQSIKTMLLGERGEKFADFLVNDTLKRVENEDALIDDVDEFIGLFKQSRLFTGIIFDRVDEIAAAGEGVVKEFEAEVRYEADRDDQADRDTITNFPMQHIDRDKVDVFVRQELLPLLQQPLFASILTNSIGIFSASELQVLLEKFDKYENEAATLAVDIFTFINLLKRKNYQQIAEAFISVNKDNKQISRDDIRLTEILDAISDIYDEMLNCQCHFNRHSKKGEEDLQPENKGYEEINAEPPKSKSVLLADVDAESPKSKSVLLPDVDTELADLRTHAGNSVLSRYTRKFSYLKALADAFPLASRVSAFGSEKQMRQLQQADEHMLKPVAESVDRRYLGRFVRLRHDIKAGTADARRRIANGVRSIARFVLPKVVTQDAEVLQPAEAPHLERSYVRRAHTHGKVLTTMARFTATDVATNDCDIDVLEARHRAVEEDDYCKNFIYAEKSALRDKADRYREMLAKKGIINVPYGHSVERIKLDQYNMPPDSTVILIKKFNKIQGLRAIVMNGRYDFPARIKLYEAELAKLETREILGQHRSMVPVSSNLRFWKSSGSCALQAAQKRIERSPVEIMSRSYNY